MKKTSIIVLAVAVVVWLVWLIPNRPEAAPSPPPSSNTETRQESRELEVAREPAPVEERSAERQVLTKGQEARRDDSRTTLVGRVILAETREPLEGCLVRLTGHARDKEALWRLEREHGPVEWTRPEVQRTGPDGRFRIRFDPPPPFQFRLQVERAGMVSLQGYWSKLEAGITKDIGDLEMSAGVPVSGRVIDTKGVAQTGLKISFYIDGMRKMRAVKPVTAASTETAAEGSFALHLTPENWTLWVQDRQIVSPPAITVRESPVQVEIVVRRPEEIETIKGRVVDQAGEPIAKATISYKPSSQAWGGPETKADGTFTLERKRADRDGPIQVSAARRGYEQDEAPQPVPWQTEGVEIVLRKGLHVELQVLEVATEKPVEEFGVRYFPLGGHSAREGRVRESGQHPGGILRLEGLRRGQWNLVVEPTSPELVASPVIQVVLEDPGPPRQIIRLHAACRRKVRVVRAGKEASPVVGTRLELLEKWGDEPVSLNTWAFRWGQMWLRNPALVLDEGKTDAAGEVVLRGPPDRDLALRVLGPGHQPLVLTDLRWQPTAGRLVVEVAAGAKLVGEIGPAKALAQLDPAARIREHYEEGALRDQALRLNAPRIELRRGQGKQREWFPRLYGSHAVIAADGSYELEGVPPGLWRVRLIWREWWPSRSMSHGRYLGSVELSGGETTRFDCTLEEKGRAHLRGTVFLNNEPWANARGALFRWTTQPKRRRVGTVPFRTDGRGSFEQELEPGLYRLGIYLERVKRPYEVALPAASDFQLADGEDREVTFDLKAVSLSLRLLMPDGQTAAAGYRLILSWRQGGWFCSTPDTGKDGRTSVLNVPVGPIAVKLSTAGRKDAAKPVLIGSIDVTGPGKEITLTLPPGTGR